MSGIVEIDNTLKVRLRSLKGFQEPSSPVTQSTSTPSSRSPKYRMELWFDPFLAAKGESLIELIHSALERVRQRHPPGAISD